MTTLTALSGANLAAAIGTLSHDGKPVQVFGQLPDRFTPPAAVVTPGAPWIDNAEGYPYGVFVYTYTVRVVGGRGTNTAAADRLTALVTSVMARLMGSQTWQPGDVGQPFITEPREKFQCLAADITVTALATITEE